VNPGTAAASYRLSDFPGQAHGHLERPLPRTICVASGKDDDCSWVMAERLKRQPRSLRRPPTRPWGGPSTFITAHDGFTRGRFGSATTAKTQPGHGGTTATGEQPQQQLEYGVGSPCKRSRHSPPAQPQQRNPWPPAARARGCTMLLMGDGVRRSQGGKTTTVCQNIPSVGCNWRPTCRRLACVSSLQRLRCLRRKTRACSTRRQPYVARASRGRPTASTTSGAEWQRPSMERPDWGRLAHTLWPGKP